MGSSLLSPLSPSQSPSSPPLPSPPSSEEQVAHFLPNPTSPSPRGPHSSNFLPSVGPQPANTFQFFPSENILSSTLLPHLCSCPPAHLPSYSQASLLAVSWPGLSPSLLTMQASTVPVTKGPAWAVTTATWPFRHGYSASPCSAPS